MKVKGQFLTLFAICLFGLCAYVTDIYAAPVYVTNYGDGSCSLVNAQAAYNAATAGDTIVFPVGTCTWSSGLTIRKPLSIIGAGSDVGGTKLIASGSLPNGFFYITGFTSSSLMRISRFYFEMTNWTPQMGIKVSDSISLTSLRIDHNVFNQGGGVQILAGGSNGVIDNNYFFNGNVGIYMTAGSVDQANASWVSMAAGTSDALFIEDNHFIDDTNYTQSYSQERVGTFNGGKLVVRYNHFDSKTITATSTVQAIETHGSAAAGVAGGYWQIGTGARRGQSVVEIYENLIEGKRIDFIAKLRGSANFIYNNTVIRTGGYPSKIVLMEEEYDGGQWSPARVNWPAEDQVHNTFIWNNKQNNVLLDAASITVVPDAEKIKLDRDYFLHAPQATGGKETFTGANGASGSYPTDGVTYPTRGTMVFSAEGPNAYYGYTPYTYPHPLSAPAPPRSLKVRQ